MAPLLFILYINDIVKVLNKVKIKLFADDALLYIDCNDLKDGMKIMNEDLENVYQWMCANNLAVNVKKSNCMIVTRKKYDAADCIIKIGKEKLERVHFMKYLGVFIDEKLLMVDNLNYVKSKILKKLGLLRRLSEKLNAETKILLYKSVVSPHFDYCPSMLFMLSDSGIQELQRLQNKFMRNILKLKRDTPVKSMLDMLSFMSVKQRLGYNIIKMFYKIENDLLPDYLKKFMLKNKEKNEYNLRRKSLYDIPNFTKTFIQDSLFYKGLKLFNSFKLKNVNCLENKSFKSTCIKYVKENL